MLNNHDKRGYIHHITCSEYNKKRFNECDELFKQFNKQFKGMNLSHNFLFEKILDFYIKKHTNRIIIE